MLRHIPPPIWVILILAGLYYASDVFALELGAWRHQRAGAIIVLLGLALPIIGTIHFIAAGTQVVPTSATNNKLVVGGLYRFTRNPMYLGLVIASLGAAMLFGRPLMYLGPLLVFAMANWGFIPFEEAKMRRQFGEQFDAYCKRVRRWI
jgi:protein-S-isoprenylcysteine O-methyltransferase Ste14